MTFTAGGRSLKRIKLMTLNNFIDKLLQYKDQYGENQVSFYNSEAQVDLTYIGMGLSKPIDGWGNKIEDAEEEVAIYIER